jgi:Ca2+-binding RTX toxin-like protein
MLWEHVGRGAEERRRLAFLLTAIALVLVLASGVALAVDRVGTNGPDTLRGTSGADNLLGKGGNDALFGLAGRDNLLGGEGKDWVLGGNEQRPLGGDKNLVGGPGNDGVQSGGGADNVLGGSGNDYVTGDRGSDSLVGEEGMDLVDGGPGPDRVGGGDGPDLLIDGPFEETSRDTLSGGDGNDAFFVDNRPATRDIVTCGSGFDRVAADERDLVASDCEQVRRGPNAGPRLERYLETSGFFDELFGGLAPFPAG